MNKILSNSGFASINTGTIDNCYADVIVRGKKKLVDGFCCNNTGDIQNVFTNIKVKKNSYMVKNNKGVVENSYFYSKKDKKVYLNDKLEEAPNSNEIVFSAKLLSELKVQLQEEDNYTKISTKEDLIAFRDGVNNADPTYVNGNFVLTDNIDLKSMKWLPVGNDVSPFSGNFDGNGFEICGFIVNDKTLQYGGFFGVIKNAHICNLNLDGLIRTGKFTGVFAGNNDGGTIESCSSNGKVSSGGYAAAFVGKNSGTIKNCNCYGVVTAPLSSYLLPLLLLLALLLLILALILAYLFTRPKEEKAAIPPRDPSATSISDTITSDADNTSAYMMLPTTTADSATSQLYIGYKNPNGTDKAAQLTLLTDPTNDNSKIGQSDGLIYPGQGLDYIQLTPYPDGSTLDPGTYEAYLCMQYYDVTTGDLVPVHNTAAITITIGG